MKKITLFLLFFGVATVFAQNIPLKNSALLSNKLIQKPNLTEPKTFTAFIDTLYYPVLKATGFTGWVLFNNASYSYSTGQYYNCPQSITVKGFVFYGYTNTAPTTSIIADLYLAGPDSLPTGSPLATANYTIDSFAAHAYRTVLFSAPVTVNAPYIVTLTNTSSTVANAVILYASDPAANDGQGEWLTCIKQSASGAWKKTKTFSGGSKDLDVAFLPITQCDIANPSYTFSPSCINDNTDVTFSITSPAIYSDRMYSYYAAKDSAFVQFIWDFGDGSSLEFGMDKTHTYVTASDYLSKLYFYFTGWMNDSDIDSVSQNVGVCTGIADNSADQLSIYPNPANDMLYIENNGDAQIEIFNANGSLVLSRTLEEQLSKIDITALTEGLYLVKIKRESGITTRKILIQH